MMLVDKKTGAKYRVPEVDCDLLNLANDAWHDLTVHCGFVGAGSIMMNSPIQRDLDAQISECEEFHKALKNGESLERWRIE